MHQNINEKLLYVYIYAGITRAYIKNINPIKILFFSLFIYPILTYNEILYFLINHPKYYCVNLNIDVIFIISSRIAMFINIRILLTKISSLSLIRPNEEVFLLIG